MGMMSSNKRPKVVCGPSKTQQHLSDLCSPRRLIEKYGTKRLREALSRTPQLYSDVPPVADYKEALDLINRGSQSFDSLPSGLRRRFENDPIKLLEFLHDPKNRNEAIELGLVNRPAVTDVAPAKDVKKASDESHKKADKASEK